MTVEQATTSLDATLRPYPWYLSSGVGQTEKGPSIFVYVKSARAHGVSSIAKMWEGYPVIVRPVGVVRPAEALRIKPTDSDHWNYFI